MSASPRSELTPTPLAPASESFDSLVAEAQRAESEGAGVEARQLYERALARLSEASSGAQASAVLRWIARTYRVDAELELALDCAGAALAIAEAHQDEAAIGHAMNLQAILHTKQGRLDLAEQLYQQAGESAARADEPKLSAMTAQNLGVIASIRGDLDTAARHYETSLAAYRRLGLAGDVCVALNNLGLLHTQRRRWAEAATSYDEAMCIAEALGDSKAIVQIDVNRAVCLVAQGRLAEARDACERASTRSGDLGEIGLIGELHKAFGIVEREMGNIDEAERHLFRAREIASRLHDLLLLAEVTRECAVLHRRQGRNRDTLQCLNQSHRLFAQLRARLELADVGQRMEHLESDFLDVVRRWGDSIESKDEYTQGHCERVADMACALAERTGMDEQSLFWFRIGALLHDVGKLVIPSEVLNKAGALTAEEWELVRHHPTAGVEMLADVEFPWDVRPIVEFHHERWDGHGYPKGLKGEEIPLVARILGIADVYDALTSQRSYKRPMSHDEAMDLMRLEAGKQFDPELFQLFERVAPAFADPVRRPVLATPRLLPTDTTPTKGLDELTGLPLRGALMEATSASLAERPTDGSVAMLVVDIDHFKLINDTHGHLTGDEALRRASAMLRAHARPSDLVARFAGDEFVVLMPGATLDDAVSLAHALRSAAHDIAIATTVSGAASLTLSIGVAVAPVHGTGAAELFERADRALLDAKRQGRDSVAVAGQPAAAETRVPRFDHFCGRQRERQQMAEMVERATRGDARVLALTGEAGSGKSALACQMRAAARLHSASLLTGRCLEAGPRVSYQPWIALLDAVRVLRLVPERPWQALGQLLPALSGGAAATAHRGVLYAEVVEYLRSASMVRPLVLVLEDVQWADEDSAELFEYVVDHLRRERLLLCVTARHDELRGAAAEWRRRFSRHERIRQLSLGRLTPAETGELVTHALAGMADAALVSHVHARTAGNPLFIAAVIEMLVESGELAWTGREWRWDPAGTTSVPTVAEELLGRRLARTSPEARRTLARAALMGPVADIDLGVHAQLATEDAFLDAAEEGVAAGLVEAGSARAEHLIAFTHPLLVDLLLRDIHPRRLRRLRDALAQAANDAARHGQGAGWRTRRAVRSAVPAGLSPRSGEFMVLRGRTG